MNMDFQKILEQIAIVDNTTPEHVRQEMQQAMDAAQQSRDPLIRKKWDSIPRKGKHLTLEEFVAYVVSQVDRGLL